MKILILAAVRCSLIFTAVTASLFSVQPAYIIVWSARLDRGTNWVLTLWALS